jgi:hypothetical protein
MGSGFALHPAIPEKSPATADCCRADDGAKYLIVVEFEYFFDVYSPVPGLFPKDLPSNVEIVRCLYR